jgi:hypothetical protein
MNSNNVLFVQIARNAINYNYGQIKFYTSLARSNRSKPSVHAAQLGVARKNAMEIRETLRIARGSGITLLRSRRATGLEVAA